jgi:TRAP-type mannitol/chloroaromatic compound transport system permease large subunit
MLIVYGATAGVSVVQLYAGAFFPGLMLAGLYVVYVIVVAKIKPELAPPLTAEQRRVDLPPLSQRLSDTVSRRALPALLRAFIGRRNLGIETRELTRPLLVALLPVIAFAFVMVETYWIATKPAEAVVQMDSGLGLSEPAGSERSASDVQEPPGSGGLQEPPSPGGVQEPPGAGGVQEPPGAAGDVKEPPGAAREAPAPIAGGVAEPPGASAAGAPPAERQPAPTWYWITLGIGALLLAAFYAVFTFTRLEIFKMLLASFFPLVVLILAVLGSIVFGLTTPTEAAAVGSFGGYVLAAIYMTLNYPSERIKRVFFSWIPLLAPLVIALFWFRLPDVFGPMPSWFGLLAVIGVGIWTVVALKQAGLYETVRESSFLTGKTSAMVCWLFVGSSIFSAAFALLGGQELVEKWVMSLGLTPTQFLLLSQALIFILGWPLEWTEIIVIFMPIFIPLLDNFGIDPLFFGLLVALNLQTAFLSPPVAMAAFYLKGVSPPHVTLNQIFAGMLPFMGIQVLAIFLLYMFPQIGLWLPSVLYGR